jgi:hypothetical protein
MSGKKKRKDWMRVWKGSRMNIFMRARGKRFKILKISRNFSGNL